MIRNTFARALAVLAAITFAASPALPQSQINLQTQVKGTLPTGNGGTGNNPGSAGDAPGAGKGGIRLVDCKRLMIACCVAGSAAEPLKISCATAACAVT